MATQASNFKVVFIGIFIVGAIAGVLSFAGIINLGGTSTQKVAGSVTIWGTVNQQMFQKFIASFNIANADVHVQYVEKDPLTFDTDFVEAVAKNSVPDLVLLPDNLSYRFRDKFMHIPFTSLSAQTYASSYISAADIFAMPDGYVAIPWIADPLVMYYNQDLLAASGIAVPPKTWPDFSGTVSSLTKKTSDLTITQSAAALGTYKNVTNAKDVLTLLFMQGGNPVANYSQTGDFTVHFGANTNNTEASAAKNAVNFYLSYSNPVDPLYSWHDGMMNDRDAFVRGALVYYFGRASEIPIVRAQNPNLNFNISLPPQFKTAKVPLTNGGLYGLAIPNGAKDKTLSAAAAKLLVDNEQLLIDSSGTQFSFVPTRRDVLANKPAHDAYMSYLYNVALVMRTWVDPNPKSSSTIFKDLLYSVSSGIATLDISLLDAGNKLYQVGANI